jgi:hypothetical protein
MNSTDAAPKKNAPRRRSQRVMLAVRVLVSGNRPTGHAFTEEVSTVVVNAHGALIVAAEPLHVSQLVTIKHVKSGEEQMCRVVQIETTEAGSGTRIPRACPPLLASLVSSRGLEREQPRGQANHCTPHFGRKTDPRWSAQTLAPFSKQKASLEVILQISFQCPRRDF